MTNRATANEVLAIVATDKTDIEPYIEAANQLVTELLSSSGFSDDRLKEIERWLAAHFLSVSDTGGGAITEHETGDTRVRYQSVSGENLRNTSYGSQVLLLDTSGAFARLGMVKASFRVI